MTRNALETECNDDVGKSCLDLGSMWKNGQGGAKDLAKARKYYEMACDNGEWMGCIFAGRMWRNGEGGPVNEKKARYYFEENKRLSRPGKDAPVPPQKSSEEKTKNSRWRDGRHVR